MKEDIGGYIWAKLGFFGFVTGVQTFQVSSSLQCSNLKYFFIIIFLQDKRVKDAPQGTNILGILPGSGWGTADDRILVVGAHWDTVHESGGVDDNGGGVSALLELARQVLICKRKTKRG